MRVAHASGLRTRRAATGRNRNHGGSVGRASEFFAVASPNDVIKTIGIGFIEEIGGLRRQMELGWRARKAFWGTILKRRVAARLARSGRLLHLRVAGERVAGMGTIRAWFAKGRAP